jgi:hypothetical protein
MKLFQLSKCTHSEVILLSKSGEPGFGSKQPGSKFIWLNDYKIQSKTQWMFIQCNKQTWCCEVLNTTPEVQMAKKDMKNCSIFLVLMEMQIKTTLRVHLTAVRMATIKNTNNNKCWQG